MKTTTRKYHLQPRLTQIDRKISRAYTLVNEAMHTGGRIRYDPRLKRDVKKPLNNEQKIAAMRKAFDVLGEAVWRLEDEIDRCEYLLDMDREERNA